MITAQQARKNVLTYQSLHKSEILKAVETSLKKICSSIEYLSKIGQDTYKIDIDSHTETSCFTDAEMSQIGTNVCHSLSDQGYKCAFVVTKTQLCFTISLD